MLKIIVCTLQTNNMRQVISVLLKIAFAINVFSQRSPTTCQIKHMKYKIVKNKT